MKIFNILILLIGIPLLLILVYMVGPLALWQEFVRLGWKLVPLILLEGAGSLFHTQGWRHCLSGAHRSLPFGRMYCLMMAGSSINYLTPTAGLGGEVAKGLLLSSGRSGPQAASAVLVDKTSIALAQIVFISSGLGIFVKEMEMPTALWVSLITATALVTAGVLIFLVIQRKGRVGSVVRWAVHHGLGGSGLAKASASITEVDGELLLFHRDRTSDFIRSLLWHLAGIVWGFVPTLYFLMVTRDLFSPASAIKITFLGKWFDLVSFAIPADIGIQEAGRVLAFTIAGLSSALGLTFAFTRRIQQIFWAAIGLALYGLLVATPLYPVSRPDLEPRE